MLCCFINSVLQLVTTRTFKCSELSWFYCIYTCNVASDEWQMALMLTFVISITVIAVVAVLCLYLCCLSGDDVDIVDETVRLLPVEEVNELGSDEDETPLILCY